MKKEHALTQAMLAALSRRRFLTGTIASAATVTGMTTFSNANQAFAASLSAASASTLTPSSYGPDHELVLGHDISTLQQLEDVGKTFSDHGRVQPAERILAAHGATYIRERLWVNPPMPYNDLPHVLRMARRIKAAGLKFLLDIHYSDFWADPGKQYPPASWQNQDLATLTNTVYDYTRDVIEQLARQGTPPDMVQTGNEVTNGMLWPLGEIYIDGGQNWSGFTTLLKAAIAGARDGNPRSHKMRIMVHIDRGGDNGGSQYFYDNILAQGVDFDVIGLSYYPFWHGPLSALQANLNDLSPRYEKDIVVVETAYPWTLANGDSLANEITDPSQLPSAYPATPEGQLAYIRAILSIISQVPEQRARGMVYWEPAWIPGVGWEPGAGNAWDNMTLFDFNGRALSSIKCYENVASLKL